MNPDEYELNTTTQDMIFESLIEQETTARDTIHVEVSKDGGAVSIETPSVLEVLALALVLGAAIVGGAIFCRRKRDEA